MATIRLGKIMYENTLELAENKLLLLYILHQIGLPISNNQLTQIILENGFINYFTLQQYLSDLKSSNFIEYSEKDGRQRLTITEKGSKVLALFQNRISQPKVSIIDTYLKDHILNIKREVTVFSDYTIESDNTCVVNLKVTENDFILLDIKINVPSKKHAAQLCSKWKSNSSKMYNEILKTLLSD